VCFSSILPDKSHVGTLRQATTTSFPVISSLQMWLQNPHLSNVCYLYRWTMIRVIPRPTLEQSYN
jgi:hypothetical protein